MDKSGSLLKKGRTRGTRAPAKDAKSGVDLINEYLEHGKEIIVGVDHSLNYKIYSKKQQKWIYPNEGTTDHYIVIVGRGQDANGVYYLFDDVGTSNRELGTSSANKLYLHNDWSLSGKTAYRLNINYTVSMVRANGN